MREENAPETCVQHVHMKTVDGLALTYLTSSGWKAARPPSGSKKGGERGKGPGVGGGEDSGWAASGSSDWAVSHKKSGRTCSHKSGWDSQWEPPLGGVADRTMLKGRNSLVATIRSAL